MAQTEKRLFSWKPPLKAMVNFQVYFAAFALRSCTEGAQFHSPAQRAEFKFSIKVSGLKGRDKLASVSRPFRPHARTNESGNCGGLNCKIAHLRRFDEAVKF